MYSAEGALSIDKDASAGGQGKCAGEYFIYDYIAAAFWETSIM
ncbi:MAG TPA: hypothetical protein PLU43_02155 [Lachnospiraceae bacterium]|nr:hypothetical protein [Lachnospiraceae bacterium]